MSRRPGETAQAVLEHLRTVPGFLSGVALSADLGLSRMAISKAVEEKIPIAEETKAAPPPSSVLAIASNARL